MSPRDLRDADYKYFTYVALVRYTLPLLYSYVSCNRVALRLLSIEPTTERSRRPETHRSRLIQYREADIVRDIVNSNCLHARVAYHSAGCHLLYTSAHVLRN